MHCIELFAGAGGAALGLEAAGFHHTALVERDPDACAVLMAAGLHPVVEGDVRDLDAIAAAAAKVTESDPFLLWSSFPCQAFSHAGQRKGADDERNGWPWTVDAIDRFSPRWFIAENVRGLLSMPYFEEVILPDLRKRFDYVGHYLLDAASFGVPQRRRRVFIWAGPAPVRAPAATHGSPDQVRQGGLFRRTLKPWVSMGEALNLTSSQSVTKRQHGTKGNEPVCTAQPSPAVGRNLQAAGIERTYRDITDEPCNQMLERPAPTVTTTEVSGTRASAKSGWTYNGGPDRASDALFMGTGRRRLTVEECAILQDFPPDHPWSAARTKAARYRCVGNAVPPKLAEVVGSAVLEAEHALAE